MNRLLIDPAATAAALVADYAKTDPIAADEAAEGVCALPELTAEQMAEGDITSERL